MTLTEEEAKKRWCPFAMTPNYNSTTCSATNRNLHGEGLRTASCIASACMAWRPIESPEFKKRADEEFHKSGSRLTANTGYCGLGGKL